MNMVEYKGHKYNCEACIRHHQNKCKHHDRILYLVKQKAGRPFAYCRSCSSRLGRKILIKECQCTNKTVACNAIKKNPETGVFEEYPCDDMTAFQVRANARSKKNRNGPKGPDCVTSDKHKVSYLLNPTSDTDPIPHKDPLNPLRPIPVRFQRPPFSYESLRQESLSNLVNGFITNIRPYDQNVTQKVKEMNRTDNKTCQTWSTGSSQSDF